MVVIATQRGSARRIVAFALFVLIPLMFGVLALREVAILLARPRCGPGCRRAGVAASL